MTNDSKQAKRLPKFPCIVIPYLKSAALGEELRYALRAWDKNLSGYRIVIIGDREEWFSTEVEHRYGIDTNWNPQINTAHKLKAVIADNSIPDKFILSNDDIIPMNPIRISDLEVLRCNGVLSNNPKFISEYRTQKFLIDSGLSPFDYSTHTPYLYDKDKLAKVIVDSGALENGHLIESLYYNTVFSDKNPEYHSEINDSGSDYVFYAYADATANGSLPTDFLSTTFKPDWKFLNFDNSSYYEAMLLLKKAFPGKSRFEIQE